MEQGISQFGWYLILQLDTIHKLASIITLSLAAVALVVTGAFCFLDPNENNERYYNKIKIVTICADLSLLVAFLLVCFLPTTGRMMEIYRLL